MKSKPQLTTREITEIAMSVAALIVGGYLIYIVSSQFPLPGVKYTVMAPYLSLIAAFVLTYFNSSWVLLIVNMVFAMVMTIISPYMGISIIAVALLTHFSYLIIRIKARYRTFLVASLYSSYVVGVALWISKTFIGTAIFKNITLPYVLLLMLLAFFTGAFGAHFGVIIGTRVKSNV